MRAAFTGAADSVQGAGTLQIVTCWHVHTAESTGREHLGGAHLLDGTTRRSERDVVVVDVGCVLVKRRKTCGGVLLVEAVDVVKGVVVGGTRAVAIIIVWR